MHALRTPALFALVAAMALVTTGCETRSAKSRGGDDRAGAEIARLQDENAKLAQENQGLRSQLDERRGGTVGDGWVGDLPDGMERTAEGGVALSDDFAFAKGSVELNAAGKKSIGDVAAQLKGHAGTIIVEGHTDDTPVTRALNKERYVDNWGMSAARAAAVVRALVEAGVPAEKVKGAFRGEHAPRGSDKAKNRRVEIFLVN
jgi:chemotaxis protein MotB